MRTTKRPDNRPAFQFYPDDWTSETGLRLCDLSARGLWIDLLCHMFRAPNRGELSFPSDENGSIAKQTLSKNLSSLIGRPESETETALKQLVLFGVCETTEDGRIYNRRMVRDEKVRASKSKGGRKGGLKSRPPSRKKAKGGSPSPSPKINKRKQNGGTLAASPPPSFREFVLEECRKVYADWDDVDEETRALRLKREMATARDERPEPTIPF